MFFLEYSFRIRCSLQVRPNRHFLAKYHSIVCAHSFDNYLDIYERIYTFFCQNEHKQWQDLFDQIIRQSSTPYQLLYMFLEHTISTTNNKKHKMVVPLIEQFKRNDLSHADRQLDERVKSRILSKICRRCVFSQLESIIDIFDLRSCDNRSLVIRFIDEQFEQQQDIIFIAHMTKILKLLLVDAIPAEKVWLQCSSILSNICLFARFSYH